MHWHAIGTFELENSYKDQGIPLQSDVSLVSLLPTQKINRKAMKRRSRNSHTAVLNNGAAELQNRKLRKSPKKPKSSSEVNLYDVYGTVVGEIKDALVDLRGDGGAAVGIKFDGWSDIYKRHPYLGLTNVLC